MARAWTWPEARMRPVARWLAALLGVVTVLTGSAAHAALAYRRPITIDGTRVAGGASLTSFPVLVSIMGDANLRSVANGGHVASELGYDIQFRAADGTTVLDHEIERYAPQAGILVAWVRVPSLAAGAGTLIYVYYGDAGVTCPLARPREVWDASFRAVYHLQGNVLESSALAQDAVDFGTTPALGKIAAARALDGVSAFVETPVDDLRTANDFSISTWFKADQTNFARHLLWQGQGGPLNQAEQAGANNGWGNPSTLDQEMHVSLGDITSTASVPNRLSFFLGNNDRALNPNVVSFSTPFTDTAAWHHVAVVVQNAGTAPTAVMLLDGVQVCPGAGCDGSVSSSVPAPRGNWDTPLRLGRPGPAEREYDGTLDEVHVSTTARTTGWLQTEYNNQNQPQKNAACTDGGFYCLGVEEAVSAAVTSCAAPGTPGADGLLTVAGAGTTLNRYGALAADAARGASTVTVTNIASLTPLAAGDLLLLIQMQGATVNAGAPASLADSPRYGTVRGLGNAGRYELATVQGIAANTITLFCPLQNSYTAAGQAQVIRVPQYTTLTVNAGASVVAPAWNGATGGVVAVRADSIVLNGAIDVSGRGFRGGTGERNATMTYGVTAFVAGATNLGGEKGEGIAGPATSLSGGRYGRGAPANGGGGGDGHNSSGGGGSNANSGTPWTGLGNPDRGAGIAYDPAWNLEAAGFATSASSGGGRGGYTYSNSDQNALAVAPGNALWTQDNRREVGGRGGHPLEPDVASRLYMGGGGGAGQTNDDAVAANASGGNGGGIVMLLATSVSSSSTPSCSTLTACIRADGSAGGSTAAGSNMDGSGGGGGGGTVVVRTASSLNGVALQANGGVGGSQGSLACVTSPTSCEAEGPGGGGGGGFIAVYAPSGTFTRTANGGTNGITGAAALTEFPPNGATRGAAGKTNGLALCLTGSCLSVPPVVPMCGRNLVMVTADGTFNSGFEAARKLLFESWGYTVTAIDDSTASYAAAAAANNVMFLSNSAAANQGAGTKAAVETIGVVSEGSGDGTWQDLLFSQFAARSSGTLTAVTVTDNTQSISTPFALGPVTLYSAADSREYWTRSLAGTGAQGLATSTTAAGDLFLISVERSAALYTTPPATPHTAAGRRVLIGTAGSNPSGWTASLRTLMQRSLGWGTCSTATAVTLMSFSAAGIPGGVEVSWQTGSELNNLGFNLYRSVSEDGPYERITAAFIPGLGSSPVGASYSYLDPGLVAGQRYYYRLEDVDTRSGSTYHGPVSAVPLPASLEPMPVPSAGEISRASDSGASSSECPAWVLTAYSSLAPAGNPPTVTCTRHGEPEKVSIDVTHTADGAIVDLRTGGFYAVQDASGVRAFVPGFDFASEPQAAALPLKRVLVDAVVGRRAHLASVEARDWASYFGLLPAARGRSAMVVSRDGSVRAGSRALPRSASRGGLRFAPEARLAGVSFIGESKAVTIELSPLRFDPRHRAILLARRLRVRVASGGAEAGESGHGFRGRRPRPDHDRAGGGSNGSGSVSGETLARLFTTARGLHAVAFESLFPAGHRAVAVRSLRLQRGDENLPLHVEPARPSFGPGSVLYFVAPDTAASTDYSGEIAYELVAASDGTVMTTRRAAPSGPAVSAPAMGIASFEVNRLYQPGLLDAADLWQWDFLSSGVARTKPFTLAGVDPSATGALTVFLQGGSESGNDVDHHVKAAVNGVDVGETTFAGTQPWLLTATVPAGLLREGANELTLTNAGDTGVASLVFLDRFSIEYPKTAIAAAGLFDGRFASGGSATVTTSGVPVVVDVTASPQWLAGFAATGASVSFQVEGDHRYVVAAPEGLLVPRVVVPASTTLRDVANQADYILIAPEAFLPAAGPLLERRQGQGLAVKAVSLEDVASAFGGGSPSADAVRAFISYAYQSWRRPSPRYVLLLGGSSYDPRNFIGTSRPSPLPFAQERTAFLWTASDPSLAAVNGEDAVPDLALGRLPAHTVAQAEALVAKVLDWEGSGQSLAGNAVLVADNPDRGGDFDAEVDEIAESFLGGRDTQVLKMSALGASTRPAVLDAWNAGSSLLSYVGHGAAAVWASEGILSSFDAKSLQAQPRQPLLSTLNCLNGYFVAAAFDSLAEAFVKVDGRGAIAAVSPSGLSLDAPAHVFHRALMAEITSGRHHRLGDAFLAAQQSYVRSGESPELVSIYHLFGDPALSID